MQPWYSALPLPVAAGPPHEVHCTPVTTRVPSAVSCKERGCCSALPTAPWKYAAAAGAAGEVDVLVAGEVLVAGNAEPDVVGAEVVTVVVLVAPHAVSPGMKATTASRRPRFTMCLGS